MIKLPAILFANFSKLKTIKRLLKLQLGHYRGFFINKNNAESGSYKKSKGMFKVSALIQENKVTTWDLFAECSNSINAKTETTNEARMLTQAIPPDKPLLIFFPKKPLIKKPVQIGLRSLNNTLPEIIHIRMTDFPLWKIMLHGF